MIRETYKGRKLKVVKGRGADSHSARLTVNGVDMGMWMGTEKALLDSACGYVDHADEVGVGSGRYEAAWYVPGTYELCDAGHAKPIGGACGHDWCVKQRG